MKRIIVSQAVKGGILAIRGVPYLQRVGGPGEGAGDTVIRGYGAVHGRQPGRGGYCRQCTSYVRAAKGMSGVGGGPARVVIVHQPL